MQDKGYFRNKHDGLHARHTECLEKLFFVLSQKEWTYFCFLMKQFAWFTGINELFNCKILLSGWCTHNLDSSASVLNAMHYRRYLLFYIMECIVHFIILKIKLMSYMAAKCDVPLKYYIFLYLKDIHLWPSVRQTIRIR